MFLLADAASSFRRHRLVSACLIMDASSLRNCATASPDMALAILTRESSKALLLSLASSSLALSTSAIN